MASMPLGQQQQQQLQPPQVATPPQQPPQAENDPMKVDSRGLSDAASSKVISALGHFLSVRDGAVYGPRIAIDSLDMPRYERSLRRSARFRHCFCWLGGRRNFSNVALKEWLFFGLWNWKFRKHGQIVLIIVNIWILLCFRG